MQTDLSYGVQQEQHDTHASWLPRACLFRIFTSHWDNCDFPDILILSHCVGGLKVPSPSDMRTCYANVIQFIVSRVSLSRSCHSVKFRDWSYTIHLIYTIHLSIIISSLLRRRGICVTRVRIIKCKRFTFKPMIKIECNGRTERLSPRKYL